MSKIMYGSQTYPWQMNVEKFHGQVPHMVSVLKKAGFTGMEAEIVMLGDYYKDWVKCKEVLDAEGITFAALAVHEDWLLPKEKKSLPTAPLSTALLKPTSSTS